MSRPVFRAIALSRSRVVTASIAPTTPPILRCTPPNDSVQRHRTRNRHAMEGRVEAIAHEEKVGVWAEPESAPP